MEHSLSYVLVTPYTIAKSRTGGVLSRLLSRLDIELVGAQMFAPDEHFVAEYAKVIRQHPDGDLKKTNDLLADYVEHNMVPSQGRRHRSMLLIFRGEDPCRKLSEIVGPVNPERRSIDSLTGENIRDTYADLIMDPEDPQKVTYFEPAVLTPRLQETANLHMKLFADWLPDEQNLVENMIYPNPKKIQRSLVIIKPDNWKYASSKPGTIIDMFSRTGLRIIGVKVHRMSVAQALEFYGPVKDALKEKLSPVFGRKAKEHLETHFNITLTPETEQALAASVGVEYAVDQFEQIIEFMSGIRPSACPLEELNQPGSVKCMILIYEGEDAIDKIRDVLGPTDPLKAPGGTVRREFGSNIMVNTAHASDSAESAQREMGVVKIHDNSCGDIMRSYLSMMPKK
ncbi:nucleoside-diphosphate kinase [Pleomorphochaeta sp. DL1XJH-081]|jgi:nucleoside diphosphate kinase|uniref:nucleoside-diphosphate kinase n=1 Tax=Pleomorphochaeta sp. DL1XJH-081 TaxID=3409690 RepID=UPI003BB4AB0F